VLVSKKTTTSGANGIDDAVRLFLPTGELTTGLLEGTHSVNTTVKIGNMTALVGLASINVSGLASLSSFHVFEAMGPHTLRSIVTLSGALLLSLDAFAHAHAHIATCTCHNCNCVPSLQSHLLTQACACAPMHMYSCTVLDRSVHTHCKLAHKIVSVFTRTRFTTNVADAELALTGFAELWPSNASGSNGYPNGVPALQWFDAVVRVTNITLVGCTKSLPS
jgi:hypothetical protein